MELADIIALFGASYQQKFGARIPSAHLRAMASIQACRTWALGGHIVTCADCGVDEYVYHSCRHRACPKCGRPRTAQWLEARRTELLPVPYFHVVFTLPCELRRLVRKHQRVLYGVLMRAAAHALIEVAADKRFVGAQIAVMAVLHTWARTLAYHPHVHCLVPAGGLADDGTWRPVTRNYLVSGVALAKCFRGKFVAMAREALPGIELPGAIFGKPWVVHLDAARQGTDVVLRYLARYVQRVALTNARILGVDDGRVVFRYRDRTRKRWRTMRLTGHEFLRRFLQHVPPPGLHKVRYFGLWAPGNKSKLQAVRRQLIADEAAPVPTDPKPSLKPVAEPVPHWLQCQACGAARAITATLPRVTSAFWARGPP